MRDTKRPLMILALGMVLTMALAGCGASSSSANSSPGDGTAPATGTLTPATATPNPTVAATPTNTPGGSGILTGATLGGTDAGFSAQYTSHGGGVYQQNSLLINVYFGFGVDGAGHANSIMAEKIDASTWTADQAQRLCTQFNPPDAAHQSDTHDNQGNLVQIFISKRLAHTFPASVFYPQQNGIFSIDYLHHPGESGIFECDIHLGGRA